MERSRIYRHNLFSQSSPLVPGPMETVPGTSFASFAIEVFGGRWEVVDEGKFVDEVRGCSA